MDRIIDLSHHNTVSNWKEVASAIDGVIIRLGYGNRHDDRKGAEYVRAAIDHQIPYALYWYSYALNKEDIENEADGFLDAYYRLSLSVPPVFYALDMEDADKYKENHLGLSDKNLIHHCGSLLPDWLFAMQDKTNIPLAIYMSNYWWENSDFNLGNDTIRWVARWNTDNIAPSVPYDIWQYTNTASVPGINGYVDASRTEDRQNLWKSLQAEKVLYVDEYVCLILKDNHYYLEVM